MFKEFVKFVVVGEDKWARFWCVGCHEAAQCVKEEEGIPQVSTKPRPPPRYSAPFSGASEVVVGVLWTLHSESSKKRRGFRPLPPAIGSISVEPTGQNGCMHGLISHCAINTKHNSRIKCMYKFATSCASVSGAFCQRCRLHKEEFV